MTLVLDAASQAWFDALRHAHFPPERRVVGAHVTLFHALPGDREAELARLLADLAATAFPMPVRVAGVRFLGRGVAFALEAPEAAALRKRVAASFASDLSAQDRAAWSPHVTVQNKVTPERARRTAAALGEARPPAPVRGVGVALWRYLGGPWEEVATWG